MRGVVLSDRQIELGNSNVLLCSPTLSVERILVSIRARL